MPDASARRLDGEILAFLRRHRARPAPERDFERLALRVYAHQFEKNRHYRRFCERQGKVPAVVRQWRDIPALPALAFKELVLASFPAGRKRQVFRTSGTTQERRGAHLFDTLKLYESALLPPFKEHVLRGKKADLFILISPWKERRDSSLSYMMRTVERLGGPTRYYVKDGRPRYETLARDLAAQRKPAVILATAFALKGFLDHLKSRRIRLHLPKGSRVMETGGFKGRAEEVSKKALYAACRTRLGVAAKDCVSEYGMTELSSQYYAGPDGVFHAPATMRAMVIDPKTGAEAKKGKAGLLKHIDIANRGSVVAVQTEDLGRAKGAGFQFLGRASASELRGCSLSYEDFIRRGE